MRVVVVMKCQSDLLQIILAGASPCCFACLLDRRQQQRDQNCNDGDDHQQLDESEGWTTGFGPATPAT